MTRVVLVSIDIVAVTLLVFGLYFPRHRRRDLVVAYLGVNVGVLAVASALSTAAAPAPASASGSRCSACCRSSGCAPPSSTSTRWRTTSPRWHWASSAPRRGAPSGISAALMALILLVMAVGDHPAAVARLPPADHRARPGDHRPGRARRPPGAAARRPGTRRSVQRVDLVNDTTVVDVRYSARAGRPPPRPTADRRHGRGESADDPG